MSSVKVRRSYKILMVAIVGIILFLGVSVPAQAAGFADETEDGSSPYSDYPLDNYQLDFYVDSGGAMPWHWKDNFGKAVDMALYKLTDMLWSLSRDFSNGTGYVVQEAFKFDFMSSAVYAIGNNIRAFAGINAKGFTGNGFYNGFLLLLVFVLGVYVAYVGLIKRETTKALNAAVSFVVIFVVTTGFIAFAPSYITRINGFSADVSTAALSVGLEVMGSESKDDSSDSVDLVRKSLFTIQIEKPWLLLQYGTTNVKELTDGEERVGNLLSKSSGNRREKVVENEVGKKDEDGNITEGYANAWMSVDKVSARLGMVLLILVINIAISIFVILFCGLMLFSQIMFMIYATMLPISFLLSMIPTCNGMVKHSIERLFNIIMLRAGYTLIITVAFSISSLLYSLSAEMPFLFMAFLQILCFAGIYMKHNDLLGLFMLKSNENSGTMRHMRQGARRMKHNVTRTTRRVAGIGKARATSKAVKSSINDTSRSRTANANPANAAANTTAKNQNQIKKPVGEKVGRTAGKIADMPSAVKDGAGMKLNQVKNTPTHLKHTAQTTMGNVKSSASSVKTGVKQERMERRMNRAAKKTDYQNTVAREKADLSGADKKSSVTHRPVTTGGAKTGTNSGNNSAAGQFRTDRNPDSAHENSLTATHTKDSNVKEKPVTATHAKVGGTQSGGDAYKVNGKTYTKKQLENFSGIDTKPKTRRKVKGDNEGRQR